MPSHCFSLMFVSSTDYSNVSVLSVVSLSAAKFTHSLLCILTRCGFRMRVPSSGGTCSARRVGAWTRCQTGQPCQAARPRGPRRSCPTAPWAPPAHPRPSPTSPAPLCPTSTPSWRPCRGVWTPTTPWARPRPPSPASSDGTQRGIIGPSSLSLSLSLSSAEPTEALGRQRTCWRSRPWALSGAPSSELFSHGLRLHSVWSSWCWLWRKSFGSCLCQCFCHVYRSWWLIGRAVRHMSVSPSLPVHSGKKGFMRGKCQYV